MKMNPLRTTWPTAQRGWTLVEILVAMTLGLLIIAGIGQIYLAAKRSYDIQTSIARIQDVGRYTTEILTQDVRRAGYWGLLNMQNAMSNTSLLTPYVPADNTCQTGNTSWGSMVEGRIFGLDDTSGNYSCISRAQGDVLVVRYGDPATVTPYSGTGLYMRATPFTATIALGPAGTATPPPSTLDYALVARAYYVRKTVTTNCGNSKITVPDLAREELDNSGRPITKGLVTGVEWLEFQYGVDTDGLGTADTYMDAGNVDNWNPGASLARNWSAVRTVRFWVLARDDCPEGNYTDNKTYNMGNRSFTPTGADSHFRRALYSSTVTIRSDS
jgi:type IV pilus assembly protein PilW